MSENRVRALTYDEIEAAVERVKRRGGSKALLTKSKLQPGQRPTVSAVAYELGLGLGVTSLTPAEFRSLRGAVDHFAPPTAEQRKRDDADLEHVKAYTWIVNVRDNLRTLGGTLGRLDADDPEGTVMSLSEADLQRAVRAAAERAGRRPFAVEVGRELGLEVGPGYDPTLSRQRAHKRLSQAVARVYGEPPSLLRRAVAADFGRRIRHGDEIALRRGGDVARTWQAVRTYLIGELRVWGETGPPLTGWEASVRRDIEGGRWSPPPLDRPEPPSRPGLDDLREGAQQLRDVDLREGAQQLRDVVEDELRDRPARGGGGGGVRPV